MTILSALYMTKKNETGYKNKEKNKSKTKGRKYKEQGLLQIEVRKEGTDKRACISTRIKIRPDQYSDKNGFTCRNHDNAKSITGRAQDRFRKIETFVSSEKCPNIDSVKYWDKEEFSSLSVVDFIKEELKRRKPSFAVVQYNNSSIKRLDEYEKIKTFSDLTYHNIVVLDTILRKHITSEPTLYKRYSLI